jgi:hypothetical protein
MALAPGKPVLPATRVTCFQQDASGPPSRTAGTGMLVVSGGRTLHAVRPMRFFSVEEATRLVPLLTRTFGKVRPWVERVQKLADVLDGPKPPPESDETRTQREERDTLLEHIRGELGPLQEMGLEIKGADGLVDFHARRGEEPVYLCWRYGEDAVTHWHDLKAGFSGRRPIDSPDDFEPTYLS